MLLKNIFVGREEEKTTRTKNHSSWRDGSIGTWSMRFNPTSLLWSWGSRQWFESNVIACEI